jgi:hypothetical protein
MMGQARPAASASLSQPVQLYFLMNKKAPAHGQGWCWWRRRESNPRPQVLCFSVYMFRLPIHFNCPVTRRSGRSQQRFRLDFSVSAPDELQHDPVKSDTWNPDAQARLRSDGTLLGIKQRVRSCRRLQLYFCDWIYVVLAPRHATEVSQPASKPGRPQCSHSNIVTVCGFSSRDRIASRWNPACQNASVGHHIERKSSLCHRNGAGVNLPGSEMIQAERGGLTPTMESLK